MGEYWGLIEAMMTLGGVSLFVWWQMRVLNRDVAARKAREAREAEAAEAAARLSAAARPGGASGTEASS